MFTFGNLYVVIEGGDKVGKSTLISNLTQKGEFKNVPYLITKEPTDTFKKLIMERSQCSDIHDLFLFIADRCKHLAEVVIPFFKKHPNGVVIQDRGILSTFVYQYGHYLFDESLIEKQITHWIPPEIKILLNEGTNLIISSYLAMFKRLATSLPNTVSIVLSAKHSNIKERSKGTELNKYDQIQNMFIYDKYDALVALEEQTKFFRKSIGMEIVKVATDDLTPEEVCNKVLFKLFERGLKNG